MLLPATLNTSLNSNKDGAALSITKRAAEEIRHSKMMITVVLGGLTMVLEFMCSLIDLD
jgi:hypothetical protein